MKDYIDLTREDLAILFGERRIPHHFRRLQKAISSKKIIVVKSMGNHVDIYSGDDEEWLRSLGCKMWGFDVENFNDITEEVFTFIFGKKTADKYIWLQRYLKGQEHGVYNDAEYEKRQAQIVIDGRLIKANEKIDILTHENRQLKRALEESERKNKTIMRHIIETNVSLKKLRQISDEFDGIVESIFAEPEDIEA